MRLKAAGGGPPPAGQEDVEVLQAQVVPPLQQMGQGTEPIHGSKARVFGHEAIEISEGLRVLAPLHEELPAIERGLDELLALGELQDLAEVGQGRLVFLSQPGDHAPIQPGRGEVRAEINRPIQVLLRLAGPPLEGEGEPAGAIPPGAVRSQGHAGAQRLDGLGPLPEAQIAAT